MEHICIIFNNIFIDKTLHLYWISLFCSNPIFNILSNIVREISLN